MWLKMCLLKNLFVGAVRRWSSGDDPSALKFEKRDSNVAASHSGVCFFLCECHTNSKYISGIFACRVRSKNVVWIRVVCGLMQFPMKAMDFTFYFQRLTEGS